MTRIAFLGMGAMGRRMARRLIQAGHDVAIWNRTAAVCDALAGPEVFTASSPAQAAQGADLVVAMLRDDSASRSVWLDEDAGALSTMAGGAIAVECSTLTPAWIRDLGATCAARGITLSDSPVSGSLPQAEGGQLQFLSGGGAATVDRIESVLLTMGGAVHRCGPLGSGTVAKLMVNALFGVQVAALAEIQGAFRAAGIDLTAAADILAGLPVCSPAAVMAMKSMLSEDFPPAFPLDLVDKDFGYVVQTASALGAAMPIAGAASSVFREATARGYGGDNITGVVQLYR